MDVHAICNIQLFCLNIGFQALFFDLNVSTVRRIGIFFVLGGLDIIEKIKSNEVLLNVFTSPCQHVLLFTNPVIYATSHFCRFCRSPL